MWSPPAGLALGRSRPMDGVRAQRRWRHLRLSCVVLEELPLRTRTHLGGRRSRRGTTSYDDAQQHVHIASMHANKGTLYTRVLQGVAIVQDCTTGRAIFRDSGNVAEIVRKGFLSGEFPAHFSGPEIYTFRYLSHLFPMSGEAKFQLVGNCT